eukprot:scaffold2190_cov72-Cylindrotheca_fusiformis.AAC.3
MSNKNIRFLVPPLPALALAVVALYNNNNLRVEAAAFSPALFSSSCFHQQQQQQQLHRSSKRRLDTTTATTIYSFPFHHKDNANDNDTGSGSGSYSDGFLMKFHNQAQDEMQGETNALAQWNEQLEQEQQRSVKEWQDSFQRNGFADFTPPMSLGLNCLMIGGDDDDDDDTKLPWEDDAEASVTTMRMTAAENQSIEFQESGSSSSNSTNAIVQVGVGNANDDNDGRRSSITNSKTTKALCTIKPTSSSIPFSNNNNDKKNMGLSVNPKMAAAYDCIVDRGLLNGILELKDHDNNAVQELLWDAATALREHGIYVFVSNKSLLPETKSLLEECGVMAGLEWEFELDGISSSTSSSVVVNAHHAEQQQSSTTEVVSVARRFCNGAMPNVGRLSRFQR